MSGKSTVLIVDDDEVVRRSFRRSLEGAARHVAAAADGREALETMARAPCDVVLLDLRMPGQDGLAVLAALKQNWPDSEVVIVTGFPTVDSAKEAVRLGACDYVAKPIGPAEVIAVADHAATRKRWAMRRLAEETPTQGAA